MNLPSDFIQRSRAWLGDEACQALTEALQEEAPVSVRLNRRKTSASAEGVAVPWATDAVYLSRRPSFTFDPLFHAGCYYVQEASSMFVEQALRAHVHSPVVMLDLCAAPGGKSTLVRSLLPEGSLLVANEVMRNRSQVLAENLTKWGHPDVVVTHNDPADFGSLPGLFDVMLTDVPCSGEGMFRKDATAVDEWSAELVRICWQRQRRILADAWPALRPGGLLIYSTCTFNREENEDNVAWIADELGADVVDVPTLPEWGITGNLAATGFPVFRFLPHRTRGEGFFLAVLRKHPGERPELRVRKERTPKGRQATAATVPREAKDWLRGEGAFCWTVEGTEVTAFPQAHAAVLAALKQSLRVVQAGVGIGSLKGKDLVPHPSLALSTVRAEGFATAELDYDRAIAYLRKEAFALDGAVPRGYVLATYQQVALGWMKNIGNRANNLYPQEWRIRSGYLPENGFRNVHPFLHSEQP